MKVTTGSKLTGGLGLAISYGRVLTLILFSVVALSAVAHEAVARDTTEYAADSLSRTLNEVVVEAETIKRDGNHEIISITKDLRKNAYNTAQMLGKLPGMDLDRSDNTLTYKGKGKIKILMDSVEKEDDFIKNLSHVRFDKVDIIRNPTGRYADYDLVINLHTRENYEGYEGQMYYWNRINPSYSKGYAFSDAYTNPSFIYTKSLFHNKCY